jgi:hypothetical protein
MNDVPGGLFHQPWWLDAAAPNRWGAAEVWNDNTLVARLPYAINHKYGMTFLTRPSLTPSLGPWLAPSKAKRSRRLRYQKDLLQGLLEKLPRSSRYSISCHPDMNNLLPFHWAGYDLHVRYTYILHNLSDMEKVWAGYDSNIRTDIRKANKQVAIRNDLSLDTFLDIYEKTFLRQGQTLPLSRDFYYRVEEALKHREQRRMFFAVDAQERIHAAIYIVWDRQRAYYLMGGGDPVLRSSGASSLLLNSAIEFCSTVTTSFDFEGSMIEPIERFFRAFGGVQTPYITATRSSNRLLSAAFTLLRKAA